MITKWEGMTKGRSCEVDVYPHLQTFTSDVISRTAFGSSYVEGRKIFELQLEQAKLVIKAIQSIYIPGSQFLPTKNNRRMKEIDRNVQGNNKSGLSIDDIIEECKLFYFAGQETTANLLVWTMILLGQHTNWQDRARDEVLNVFKDKKPDIDGLSRLKVINMILQEVLRLYPPGVGLGRMIYEETKIGNITLPAGSHFLLHMMLLHHDPDIWGDDVNEFNPDRFAEALREYCDMNYHNLLPITTEKVHQEKVQQEKLKVVKARLNFEEVSQHSESGTPSKKGDLKERVGSRHVRSRSGSPEPRRHHSKSPRKKGSERKTVFKRLENGVFHRLRDKGKKFASKNIITKEHPHEGWNRCQKVKVAHEGIKAFLENYLQHKKYIKDPVEIHNIKQKDRESMKEFVRRYKLECRDVNGAPFMHGITNPELIKRLHDKIPKSVDEMMRVTTTFLRGEVAASNRERKKSFPSWKQQEAAQKQNFKKGGFRTEAETKAGQVHSPHKNTKRNFSFRQREIQASSANDNPGESSKEGGTSGKDKPLAIPMVQPWQRVSKQKITQTFSPETMISFPPLGEEDGTEGPMIIEAGMGGHFVHRMYVDGDSFSEILYEHCFNRFCSEVRSQMVAATTPLVEFSGEIIWPLGQISLLVKIGDEKHSTTAWMNFMIVRSPSPYNGIIGRPRSSRIIPLECIMISGPGVPQPVINQVIKEKIQVAIHPEYPEQTIAIGSTLTEEGRKELCDLLRRNLDIFAWKPADMTGGQALERNKAIYEEVEKLVDAGIVKEVHYHSWLSNPVMVKKHDGSWRMCVDFKDLNKACPKDGYPLPEIDWKVESLCGYPFKCFLDAYKGYHQIKMTREDDENTAFITSQGIFCYSKIPFGLKNLEQLISAWWSLLKTNWPELRSICERPSH
ncbi:reverse transcriptase domain-containing protein [Tanacetum coccineum]